MDNDNSIPSKVENQNFQNAMADLLRAIGRLPNLPAIKHGKLIEDLPAMKEQLDSLSKQLAQVQKQNQQTFNAVKASNHNSIVRNYNGRADNLSQEILPLVTLSKGIEIVGFPNSLAELENLPDSEVIGILHAVGDLGPELGNAEERKFRLRMQCGML